jgi:outer membrane protein
MMAFYKTVAATALVGALAIAAPVQAREAGDVLLRFGPATVQPDADSDMDLGAKVDLGDDTQLGVTATYMVNQWFGVELLAATPFQHNIYFETNAGRSLIGETKHLPPTVLAQFHFPQAGKFRPYIGVGVNYTTFFEEEVRDQNAPGIPVGFSLSLEDSTGVAGEIGVDVELQGDWFLNASVWQIDIDTTAELENAEGVYQGETDIEVDPTVWMLGIGRSF